MSRTRIIAGNWKLHLNAEEAGALVRGLAEGIGDLEAQVDAMVEVIVAPVALSIPAAIHAAQGTAIRVAAQNTHDQNKGAFTGELSPALIRAAGCTHCIVGHSERRLYFGETDEGVAKKTRALIAEGLIPIVCVGENKAQREAGDALQTVLSQVEAALAGVDLRKLVIAYEPVWAIGTGLSATPEDAQEVHAAIRAWAAERQGDAQVARGLQILYGGSVNPSNAAALLTQPDIDGALVGGASLQRETFLPIIEAARAN